MKLLKYVLLLILITVVTGCAAALNIQEQTNSNTLVLATTCDDIREWDPGVVNDATSADVIRLMFEGLTVRTEEGWKLGTASEYSVCANAKGVEGTVYTFTLRDDARWSDGERVTANDFEYAFKRICNPDFVAQSKDMFMCIKGAREYASGDGEADDMGVKAVDDKTLVIELSYPLPYFMEMLAMSNFSPVRRDAVISGDGWETDAARCISNGPYVLSEYYPHGFILLGRNDQYYANNSVSLPYVRFLINNFYGRVVSLYDNGQIQLMKNTYRYLDADVEERFPVKLLSTKYITFNVNSSPFDDVNVRRAFAHAVNKSSLASLAMDYEAESLIPPDLLLSDGRTVGDAEVKSVDFNQELAAELMRNSSYAGAAGTVDFVVSDTDEVLACAIADSIKDVLGIDIVVRAMPYTACNEALAEGSFDMTLVSWACDYNDLTTVLNCFLRDSSANHGHWVNAEFEKVMKLSNMSMGKKRDELLLRAADILTGDMAAAPLYYYGNRYCVRNDLVENIKTDTMGRLILKESRLNSALLTELADSRDWPLCIDMHDARGAIDNIGYFTDEAGYRFDAYVAGEHSEIYYNSEDAGNRIYASSALKELEDGFEYVIDFIGVEADSMPFTKVYMYDDYDDMRGYIIKGQGYDPDLMQSVAGTTICDDSFVFCRRYGGRDTSYMKTCVHEYTHIATFALTNDRKQAEWLLDGVASYVSWGPGIYGKEAYESVYYRGIPSLDYLENAGYDRYLYGYVMVEYIVDQYGQEYIRNLLLNYGDVEKSLDVSKNEFMSGLREFVKARMESL